MNLSIMVKNYKGKVCNMYQDEYKRWLAADLEDADLKPELARIEGNDDEIKDRFAVALKFGTAGLRGVLGAGTNRMNVYVVRQATQGLANWVKTQGGNQTVAISYDSRRPSSWPTSCTPSTLVPSWWRPTVTWRWSPSCSRRSSNC